MSDAIIVDPNTVGMSAQYLSHIDNLVRYQMAEDAYQGIVVLVGPARTNLLLQCIW